MTSAFDYIIIKKSTSIQAQTLNTDIFNCRQILKSDPGKTIEETNLVVMSKDGTAMYDYMLRNKPSDYHEVLLKKLNGQQRLFFDIDNKSLTETETIRTYYKLIPEAIVASIRKSISEERFILNKSQKLDSMINLHLRYVCMVDESSQRFSMHIVFPYLLVEQSKIKSVVETILQFSDNAFLRQSVDTQVYRDNGSLRAVMSAKSSGLNRIVPLEDPSGLDFVPGNYFVNGFNKDECDLLTVVSGSGESLMNRIKDLFLPNVISNENEIEKALNNGSQSFYIRVSYMHPCALCSATKHDNQHRAIKKSNILEITKIIPSGCKKVQLLINKKADRDEDLIYGCAVNIISLGLISKSDSDKKSVYTWSDVNLEWSLCPFEKLGGFVLSLINYEYLREYIHLIKQVKTRKLIVDNIYDLSYGIDLIIGVDVPDLLRMKNGVLDIRARKLISIDARKMYLFTKKCPTDYIPYEDLTVSQKEKMSRFVSAIDKILPPMLNGKPNNNRLEFEHIFSTIMMAHSRGFVVHMQGKSNTGKTTILHAFLTFLSIGKDGYATLGTHNIIGGSQKSDVSDGPSPSLASLKNHRLIKISEPRESYLWNDEKIKKITEDKIACRDLFKPIEIMGIDSVTVVDSNFYAIIDTVGTFTMKRLRSIEFQSLFVSDESLVDESKHVYFEDKSLSEDFRNNVYSDIMVHVLYDWYNKHHANDGRYLKFSCAFRSYETFEFFQAFRDFKIIIEETHNVDQLNISYMETMINQVMNRSDADLCEKLFYIKNLSSDSNTLKRVRYLFSCFLSTFHCIKGKGVIDKETVRQIRF
jgi:hypothetical protein